MILVRSPLRITLGGGGTDLPSYAQTFGGYCLTAGIDRYVYAAVIKPFTPGIFLKYSTCEHRERIDEVTHPIIRACLEYCSVPPQIEIAALADIPAGTGLGSSSAFTTALLLALHVAVGQQFTLRRDELAELAATIEIERLGEPIGKQDHYGTAFGGLLALAFQPDGRVYPEPIGIPSSHVVTLNDRLLLFYTGITRHARTLLSSQHAATVALSNGMLEALHTAKRRGREAGKCLQTGDLDGFGATLHEHWMEKRRRSPGMSTPTIDGWYDLARANGAVGGKLVGAGGGGCFLFYTKDPEQLRAGLAGSGLEEIRFRFDYEGTKVLVMT